MRDFQGESKLIECGRQVSLDWEVIDDTFRIYNFIVPDDMRREGIGSEVLRQVEEFCRVNDLRKIKAHIDLTDRESSLPVSQDPTVKFLQKHDFTVDATNSSETVYGIKRVN